MLCEQVLFLSVLIPAFPDWTTLGVSLGPTACDVPQPNPLEFWRCQVTHSLHQWPVPCFAATPSPSLLLRWTLWLLLLGLLPRKLQDRFFSK